MVKNLVVRLIKNHIRFKRYHRICNQIVITVKSSDINEKLFNEMDIFYKFTSGNYRVIVTKLNQSLYIVIKAN